MVKRVELRFYIIFLVLSFFVILLYFLKMHYENLENLENNSSNIKNLTAQILTDMYTNLTKQQSVLTTQQSIHHASQHSNSLLQNGSRNTEVKRLKQELNN